MDGQIGAAPVVMWYCETDKAWTCSSGVINIGDITSPNTRYVIKFSICVLSAALATQTTAVSVFYDFIEQHWEVFTWQ